MRVTPLDIIKKEFTPSRKGLDGIEVRDFLENVRETLDDLLKAMRGAGRKFDAALAELSEATAVAAAAGAGAAKPLSSDHSAIKLFLGFAED